MNTMTSEEVKKMQAHFTKHDPVLAELINSVDYPDVNPTNNIFHDLMSLVIEQQIHYRSTKKTFQKMLDLASISELNLDNFHIFEEKSFENARLSMKKIETINSVVELFSNEMIDWQQMTNEEIRKKLKRINGIGPKTIDALLIYSLQRDDIFIFDDYHIQKIIPQLYGLQNDKKLTTEIKQLSQKWTPYKSYAFRYILAWKDMSKRK